MENIFNSLQAAFAALAQHETIVWTVAAGVVAAYFIFNVVFMPYARYKRALKKNVKYLKQCAAAKTPVNISKIRIPRELCGGYDNYLQSAGRFPSEVMTFSPAPNRYFGFLIVVAAISICFATLSARAAYTFAPFMLSASFAVLQTALCLIRSFETKSAQKATLAFTRQLDRCLGQSKAAKTLSANDLCLDNDVDDAVAKINFLKANGINEETAKEVASLLSSDKLNKTRTHEQQKRLNLALNGLLQVMSKKQEQQQQQS